MLWKIVGLHEVDNLYIIYTYILPTVDIFELFSNVPTRVNIDVVKTHKNLVGCIERHAQVLQQYFASMGMGIPDRFCQI